VQPAFAAEAADAPTSVEEEVVTALKLGVTVLGRLRR
jgi:hypothetical protein